MEGKDWRRADVYLRCLWQGYTSRAQVQVFLKKHMQSRSRNCCCGHSISSSVLYNIQLIHREWLKRALAMDLLH